MGRPTAQGIDCSGCRHFLDDPRELERVFSGIIALSSAFGSCRASAGICAVDDRFHDPHAACPAFEPRETAFPDRAGMLPSRNSNDVIAPVGTSEERR
jgi:hypothetical protein